ncbi:hypothetical protein VXN63_02100 [Marinilactibacillus sp. XAAS-LB27]|uniref:hypothetical protein n=1 Tax=Marinilactibacillus sp. XAAS-LB27 TaxID=3114538 RepID=UPI002E18E5F2|nr:hypothetical protein [Marinilactibacillus sp. XAAS-LB27]
MMYKKTIIALLSLVVILTGGLLFRYFYGPFQIENSISVENDTDQLVPSINFYLSPSISADSRAKKDFDFGSTSALQPGESDEFISSQVIERDYNILMEYELSDGTIKKDMANAYIRAGSKVYSDTLIVTEVTDDGELVFKGRY